MFGTFSTFSYTRSFENAQADYDDDLLSNTRDQDYTSLGNRAILSGKFQFGLGGVIMRSQTQAWYFGIPLQGDDTVFYEASLDTLVPNKGWTITNDTDLLFWTDWDLIIGARYTVTSPLYRDEHNPGRNINGPMHRVGPFFAYQFFDDGIGTGWNKPTILVLTQWWARHRYRTTQRPGVPYLVIAFKQEGDFFTSDKE